MPLVAFLRPGRLLLQPCSLLFWSPAPETMAHVLLDPGLGSQALRTGPRLSAAERSRGIGSLLGGSVAGHRTLFLGSGVFLEQRPLLGSTRRKSVLVFRCSLTSKSRLPPPSFAVSAFSLLSNKTSSLHSHSPYPLQAEISPFFKPGHQKNSKSSLAAFGTRNASTLAKKKDKTIYVCTECGNDFAQWLGQCPACKEWNCMKRFTVESDASGGGGTKGGGGAGARAVAGIANNTDLRKPGRLICCSTCRSAS
jgi:hypothetical protein